MADYLPVIKKKPMPYLESLYDDIKARQNKDFFWPCGTQIYCGRQGQGKTISAVHHILSLKNKYPKTVLVSNLQLTGLNPVSFSSKSQLKAIISSFFPLAGQMTQEDGVVKGGVFAEKHLDNSDSESILPSSDKAFNPATDYIYFQTMDDLQTVLVAVNNGFYGVIYLIDEIHTYFNALDSKNTPMYVFTEISQQRKQRKLIVGTSQIFKRMSLAFREQCDSMIDCKTYGGFLTINHVYDGAFKTDFDDNIISKPKKLGFFFHNRKIRTSFDTYQKVVSGLDQYQQDLKFQYVDKSVKKGRK